MTDERVIYEAEGIRLERHPEAYEEFRIVSDTEDLDQVPGLLAAWVAEHFISREEVGALVRLAGSISGQLTEFLRRHRVRLLGESDDTSSSLANDSSRGAGGVMKKDEIIALVRRAQDALKTAVARQWRGEPAFRMSIPAEDSDTDLLISRALCDAREALEENNEH